MHILNNSDEFQIRKDEGIEDGGNNIKNNMNISKQLEAISESWKTSEGYRVLVETKPPVDGGLKPGLVKSPSGYWTQFQFLAKRAMLNALRNKLMVAARVVQNVFFGVILGLLYLNMPGRTFGEQNRDRPGSLYFLTLNMIMGSLFGTLGVFASEKRVFMREYGAGYYCLGTYFWSKICAEVG
jgi:ATP-binding cassette subfamily G (WHITE) protein 1